MGSGNDNWNWENGHGNSWDVFEPDRTNPDPHNSGTSNNTDFGGGGGGCAILLIGLAAVPALTAWAGSLLFGA